MEEELSERDFTVCTLVDRLGRGGGELIYDGVRVPIRKEFGVPARIARWYFGNRNTQHSVIDAAGRYLPRLAIKDGPEELLGVLGEEAFDTSPIELPTEKPMEGWDTSTVERSTPMRAVAISPLPGSLTERHGGESRAGVWGGH